MKRSTLAERHCPVARAAEQLVDAWSFVILRELFLGNRRFEGLRQHTGMSPRSLSLRLGRLVEHGVLEKRALEESPAFFEYRLTPKGLDLWPVMVTLRQWGDRRVLRAILLGAFVGPFLGIWLSLVAVQNARLGIASTLMALPPVLLIPLEFAAFRQRVSRRAIAGTVVALAGVALLFWR